MYMCIYYTGTLDVGRRTNGNEWDYVYLVIFFFHFGHTIRRR